MEELFTRKNVLEVFFAFTTVAIASTVILFTYYSIYPYEAPPYIRSLLEKPTRYKKSNPTFKVLKDSNAFSLSD